MRDRGVVIAEITDTLPEIMRRLVESRPMSSGERELTLAQVRVLSVVADGGECRMGHLARSLGISLSAATELVDRLAQQGLVERAGDPKDRRLVLLSLARAGKRARKAFQKAQRRKMEVALADLSTRELERIADSLASLRKALGVVERS